MTAPAKTPGGTAPDSRRIRQIIIPAIILAIIIVIVLLASLVFTTLPAAPAEPDEPLTIASGTLESSALTVIAVEKDYFSIHGLNVTIVEYPSGALAMKELLAGRADIAYASEFVGVSTGSWPLTSGLSQRRRRTTISTWYSGAVGESPRLRT